jgi:hypothetical protein
MLIEGFPNTTAFSQYQSQKDIYTEQLLIIDGPYYIGGVSH